MNDLVSNIIQSPEAERMLQMVTTGFYDRSELALWIFEVIGREYDCMREWSRNLAYEAFPGTCTEKTIGFWELLYGIEPSDDSCLKDRRKAVISKKPQRMSINPVQIKDIISELTGCPTKVFEHIATHTFRVEVTLTGNERNLDEVIPCLNRIKPAHLSVQVVFGTHRHQDLYDLGFTHEELTGYTHYAIRNEVF